MEDTWIIVDIHCHVIAASYLVMETIFLMNYSKEKLYYQIKTGYCQEAIKYLRSEKLQRSNFYRKRLAVLIYYQIVQIILNDSLMLAMSKCIN